MPGFMSERFDTCMECRKSGGYGIAMYRGLCLRHYRNLCEKVRHGRATWAELEEAGACARSARRAFSKSEQGQTT